ncbi:hypothetical protein FHS31_000613 [Sphingomonas vulcanisoli]|uniref:Glycoside hydrolase n=1 Tax=Sphingomonas vulcanisoli TaxID=1658060 RepID=A0ABX0TTX1_9SPHN|nr:hypothetical protein [Sphingomonas vulcanisoli]NIJ07031.1 hypothetical protein [Sphingomonas vulcanisoli]
MPAPVRKPVAVIVGLLVAACGSGALHIAGTNKSVTTAVSAVGSVVGLPGVNPLYPKTGMNLAALANYSGELPLMDRFKMGGAWIVRGGGAVDPSQLNGDGWPIAMPATGYWEINIPLDPLSANTSTEYVVRWKGTGTVVAGIVNVESRGDHQLKFVNVYGSALIDITATDPNDPIRDITVLRSDQVADYDSGKVFTPDFVNRVVKPFAAFRTMDWDQINNSQEINWADRQKPGDALWTRMPLELEVRLANEAGVDLWKTIPAHASDDYVRQTLSYIKANLSPTLKLHLEYSNEVWNGSFEQNRWAAQQAQTMWQTTQWAANTYYGYRAAQIASIGWSIFGSGSAQFRPVLGGWYGWTGTEVTDAMAKGVSFANVGTIGSLFREYAVAVYFGDALGAQPGNEADRAVVLGWANDTTGNGLTQAFQQLAHGGLLQAAGTSLDDAKYNYEPKHAAWAKANGLALVGYEGGLSFYYFMADPATKPILTNFFARLIADPRMGQLYTRWLQDFSANGGQLMENYDDVNLLSEYGPWGSLDTIYAPDTPRYTALRTAAGL